MWDDGLARLVDSAIHAHDQLVLETCISVQKEAVKVVFESLEQGLGDLVLDRGRKFFVKVELLDDQVEIINEGILNELFDGMIKLIRNFLNFVAVLKS
jgi:hypothetical protein